MKSKITTLLTVIGAATVLVLAANTVALATTGKALLVGKTTTAAKTTTLSRTTPGAALSLKTKSSTSPPLAVNGKGKVANLNADLLDGYDSSSLRPSTYRLTKSITSAVTSIDNVMNVPPGTYVVGYSAVLEGGGSTGNGAGCYFHRDQGLNVVQSYAEEHAITSTGLDPSFSGTALVTVASGDTLHFYCFANHPFMTISSEPIVAYATRTNVVGSQ